MRTEEGSEWMKKVEWRRGTIVWGGILYLESCYFVIVLNYCFI
jgi:hypothetical protein